ncbi:hypothetical protein HDU97_001887 [Phlyctochytrium planicorne]|nr:hypothetical protein HDU97_001887 [Phlyctochytrium planicorne]
MLGPSPFHRILPTLLILLFLTPFQATPQLTSPSPPPISFLPTSTCISSSHYFSCSSQCSQIILFCDGPGVVREVKLDGAVAVCRVFEYVEEGVRKVGSMIVKAGECDPGVVGALEPTTGGGVSDASVGEIGVSVTQKDRRACGVRPLTVGDVETNQFIQMQADLLGSQRAFGGLAAARVAKVNVYWHVIYAGGKRRWNGNLTVDDVNKQIDVLNKDYGGLVLFTLKGIDYTIAPVWFHYDDDAIHFEMKKALRKGTVNDLNVYTVNFTFSSLLGYATFPWDVSPSTLYQDGVVMLHSTVPTFPDGAYNLGRTLTHEAGHWLGLLHTFQDGCDGDGDFVDDTPAVAEPNYGCPGVVDSCPDQPGNDMTWNFMDYTDDV